MKNIYHFIWVLFFIISLSGCKNKVSYTTTPVPEINIDNAETRNIKLSELVSSYELVQLDSDIDAILNRPNNFAISHDYILITDWENNPAKLFTRTGHFIKNIGTIGHGPDEYLSVVSPHIDEADSSFWLLLGGNYMNDKDGWFYVYDKNGAVIQRINTLNNKDKNRNSNDVLVYKNQIVIPGNVQSKNMIEYRSVKDDEELAIPNRISKDYFTYTINNSKVYPLNDKFIFKIGEADTVYSFNPQTGEIEPLISVLTRDHQYDENKISEARKTKGDERFANIQKAVEDCYSIRLLGESDKYYMFSVTIMGNPVETKPLFVEKITNDAFFVNIENDFLGGMALRGIPSFYLNEYMVYHYPAIELMEDIEQRMSDITDKEDLSTLKDIHDGVNEGDNDILLICKIHLYQ